MDDIGDYRPGLRAAADLSVKSPLREAGLTKSEIRLISKEMGLPTWSKPAYACLASRFVYGEEITEEKLQPADISRLAADGIREKIYDKLREIGFMYVTLDMKGYRLGSMNETLQKRGTDI